MRKLVIGLAGAPWVVALVVAACGGVSSSGFQNDAGGGGGGDAGGTGGASGSGGFGGSGGTTGTSGSGGTTGIGLGDSGGPKDTGTDVIVTMKTTIYANTDTQLYTLDPTTNAVTLVGTFTGMSGSSYDSTVTDVAVDAEGNVYANTETVVYKAALPASPGTVTLTKLSAIKTASSQSFYALAIAPKGFLGAGEALIGGDGAGELWAIDTTSGAIQDLGNFGKVPGTTDGSIFGLSGDIVFYTDSMNSPTGLATIRTCQAGGKGCSGSGDFLAGIDMTALATAYTSKTPAGSLLGGIYGGSKTSVGPGTGFGHLYGLGAWNTSVYGFQRAETSPSNPPNLVSISTTTGQGTALPATFGFTSGGWSGAGVSTKVTIKVPPPPPPPPQPK